MRQRYKLFSGNAQITAIFNNYIHFYFRILTFSIAFLDIFLSILSLCQTNCGVLKKHRAPQDFMCWGLVAEDFFEGDAAHGGDFLEAFHVEFLLVAQDKVTVGLPGHGLFLEVDNVAELELR